jgi:hypothetical protein
MTTTMHKCPKCAGSGVVIIRNTPEPCFPCGGRKVGEQRTKGTGYVPREVFEKLVQEKRDYALRMRAVEDWATATPPAMTATTDLVPGIDDDPQF